MGRLVAILFVAAGVACSTRTGPPYVWACTPANYNSGGTTSGAVFIFNGSASAANVAVQILNKDGANLAGVAVPGAGGATYPGQTGTSTVAVQAGHTLIVDWKTAQGIPAAGGNVAATVKVVSDQPIVVGSNVEFSGFHPTVCGYLHP